MPATMSPINLYMTPCCCASTRRRSPRYAARRAAFQAAVAAVGEPARSVIGREALNLAPRVSEEFARQMLNRAVSTLDALPFPPPGAPELIAYIELVGKALFVAAHFNRAEHTPALAARFPEVRLISLPHADYGRALRAGFLASGKG